MTDAAVVSTLDNSAHSAKRPSPWRTPFAYRTYTSGVFWATGYLLTSLVGAEPSEPFRLSLDPATILYLLAAIAGGFNFVGSGMKAIQRLRLDMNSLMSIAIVAALIVGEAFEAATIAFLFSGAELLERFAVDRSRRAITNLLDLTPEHATKISPGGGSERVVASSLVRGDYVRVKPGERIPADGVVISGQSGVNEATITGESLPRLRRSGDRVFAGTMNLEGSLDIEVEADAAHGTLARIVQLVRQGEARRAPVEEFVQRFARVYTPAVATLALLVIVLPPLLTDADALEWFLRGITLLVIACPCALVIATPVTVVSALTSAARHGVLIKGGVFLEALGQVRALAVDKTGTLTKGVLEVSDYRASGAPPLEILRLVAAVESRSEHPVGDAIVRFARQSNVDFTHPVDNFTAHAGMGIRARVGSVEVVAGSEELVGLPNAERWGEPAVGVMQAYAVLSDGSAAVFTLRDQVRPESAAVIESLHAAGIRPIVMITGDAEAPAAVVAAQVGVDEVKSRLMPEEKVAVVRALREQHGSVAMLGDGVNDAPALAEANVGLAMGAAGSPAAIETADVALMGDDLAKLPYAIRLSRKASRTIRFNIAVAIGLKVVLAVGAIAGMVSLATAVLVGDMGGSLAVTLNALRLAATKER